METEGLGLQRSGLPSVVDLLVWREDLVRGPAVLRRLCQNAAPEDWNIS